MTGAITITNLSGYTFGISSDEASLNIQKLTVRAFTEKIEVKDRVGRIVGRVDHSLKQEYTIEGFLDGVAQTGSSVSNTALVGILTTLLNVSTLGGMASTGAILLDEPTLDYESGQLAKVTYKLTRYNDIPSTATQTQL